MSSVVTYVHQANDTAIVMASEAAKTLVREGVSLVGKVVNGAAASVLHLTVLPGYVAVIRQTRANDKKPTRPPVAARWRRGLLPGPRDRDDAAARDTFRAASPSVPPSPPPAAGAGSGTVPSSPSSTASSSYASTAFAVPSVSSASLARTPQARSALTQVARRLVDVHALVLPSLRPKSDRFTRAASLVARAQHLDHQRRVAAYTPGLLEELMNALLVLVDNATAAARRTSSFVFCTVLGSHAIVARSVELPNGGTTTSLAAVQTKTPVTRPLATPGVVETSATARLIGDVCGYPVEKWFAVTPDGYILQLLRIPQRRSSRVALFQHGVLDSPSAWVSNGSIFSLACRAFLEGYDVFLGTYRGNDDRSRTLPSRHSPRRAHTRWADSSPEFWDFSVCDHALDVMVLLHRIRQIKDGEVALREYASERGQVPSPTAAHSDSTVDGPTPPCPRRRRRGQREGAGAGAGVHDDVDTGASDAAGAADVDSDVDSVIPAAVAADADLAEEAAAANARVPRVDVSGAALVGDGRHDDDAVVLPTLPPRAGLMRGITSSNLHRRGERAVAAAASVRASAATSDNEDGGGSGHRAEPVSIVGIGHSMGGASLLLAVLTCRVLGLDHGLSRVVLLSPAGYHGAMPALVRALSTGLSWALLPLGMGPFPVQSSKLQQAGARLFQDMKRTGPTSDVLSTLATSFFGGLSDNFVFRHVNLSDYPVGITSRRVIHHGVQCSLTGEFVAWDYGTTENQRRYGQATPPLFKHALHHVDVHIHIAVGSLDKLIPASNLYMMAEDIENAAPGRVSVSTFPTLGHLDFTLGLDEAVIQHVLREMGRGAGGPPRTPLAPLPNPAAPPHMRPSDIAQLPENMWVNCLTHMHVALAALDRLAANAPGAAAATDPDLPVRMSSTSMASPTSAAVTPSLAETARLPLWSRVFRRLTGAVLGRGSTA